MIKQDVTKETLHLLLDHFSIWFEPPKISFRINSSEYFKSPLLAKALVCQRACKTFLLGASTPIRTIMEILDEEKSLLGVDLIHNKRLIAKDVNEKQILKEIKDKKAKIIVTPIGGQGFIFGRGNLQISPTVIRQVGINNIIVVATRHKIRELRSLRVDTGDTKLDEAFRGYISTKTGYREETAVRVE